MKRRFSSPWVLLACLQVCICAFAYGVEIENPILKVTFDEKQQLLSVLDKRTGRVWQQSNTLPQTRPRVECLFTTSPPTGNEGWEAAKPIAIGMEKVFNQGAVESQVHGTAWFMHDTKNMYVRVQVEDTCIMASPPDMEKFWQRDSFELWMDKTVVSFVITAPPDSYGSSVPLLETYWSDGSEGWSAIETHLYCGDAGYTAILCIPLNGIPELGAAVKKDTPLLFAIGLNNADKAGERKEFRYFPNGFKWEILAGASMVFSTGNSSEPQTVSSQMLQLLQANSEARTLTCKAALPGMKKSGELAPAALQLEYTLHPTEPDLAITFTPQAEGEWNEVTYPYVFSMAEDDSYLVFPHSEGLLTPLHKNSPDYIELNKDYIHSGFGPYCACLGLVNLAKGDGMLLLFPDTELAGYEIVDVAPGVSDVVAPCVFWRANKHRFDRSQRIIFSFQDKGGYVALAKRYQRFIKETGAFKTLADKAMEIPATSELIGAPVIWLADRWNPNELLEIAQMMKSDGIDRALIEIALSYYYLMPGKEKEAAQFGSIVKQLREMGYVVSRYDQYRECPQKDDKAPIWEQLNADAFPEYCLRMENGEFRLGWSPLYLMNPELGLALAKKHIPPDLGRYAYNGRFIDAVGTCTFWEGEDWESSHPFDAYGTKKTRKAILEYVNSLGLVVGTEGGVDYLLPNLHWLETPMSIVKWTSVGLPSPGVEEKPDFPEYQISIGTKYRIPFYSLVHHSEVLITWRYEDSPQRIPKYWQDKNLLDVLYGNPPLLFIDLPTYMKYRAAFAQTYQYVCEWTQKVGAAEMVSHRFVSEDRKIQESIFSTGDGVVVNFSQHPYQFTNTQVLPARSYLTFSTDAPGVYCPPPVMEMDYEGITSNHDHQ